MAKELTIEKLEQDEVIPFNLLALADPSIERIREYLDAAQCIIAKLDIEIKDIAIDERFQGNGYGKLMLRNASELARKLDYTKLIIGTGNSSIGQLALYRKEDFEISHVGSLFSLGHALY